MDFRFIENKEVDDNVIYYFFITYKSGYKGYDNDTKKKAFIRWLSKENLNDYLINSTHNLDEGDIDNILYFEKKYDIIDFNEYNGCLIFYTKKREWFIYKITIDKKNCSELECGGVIRQILGTDSKVQSYHFLKNINNPYKWISFNKEKKDKLYNFKEKYYESFNINYLYNSTNKKIINKVKIIYGQLKIKSS